MFDDSSPSVLSRKATQASKLEEAGIAAEPELALEDDELVLDDELALGDVELVVVVEDDDPAELGGEGGCGSGSGVAWNPAGGMVRVWPIMRRYGVARWFSSTTAYQGTP
jgi:hypothetical protein